MTEEEFLESFRKYFNLSDKRARSMYAAVLHHMKDVNTRTLTQTAMDWWLNKRIGELEDNDN